MTASRTPKILTILLTFVLSSGCGRTDEETVLPSVDEHEVSGVVVDGLTSEPLAGVIVSPSDGGPYYLVGDVTDSAGFYSCMAPGAAPSQRESLVFVKIGYQRSRFAPASVAQKVDIGRFRLNVSLQPWGECGTLDPYTVMESLDSLVTISQGVAGLVVFWDGNGFGESAIMPVARDVYVTDRTTAAEVAWERARFFSSYTAELLGTTRSNACGFFELELPPGSYSVFVKEDTLFFVNRFGPGLTLFPFDVHADSVTAVRFDIDYLYSW